MDKFYAGIGSRETPENILRLMTKFARSVSKYDWVLRSGGANGADDAFEQGASLKEIFLPWNNFNGRIIDGIEYFGWEQEHSVIAEQYHPVWNKLNSTTKAFHSRNVEQILGRFCDSPVKFVVCWTKDGKASGGTGQAMRIAEDYGIPICNLKNENFESFFKRTLINLKG